MTEELLEEQKQLVAFLNLALGPDYEVALYDMGKKPPAIVAIANGNVTGRTIGAPLTDIEEKIVENKLYVDQDWITHYRGITASKKPLRCSSYFIKNKRGRLTGLMTISFDDTRYRNIMEVLLSVCHPKDYITRNIAFEVLDNSEQDMMHSSISLAITDAVNEVTTASPERMTRAEKLQIIQILDQKGIFMLKGSIPLVAKQIGASVASVYRYIGEVHKGDGEKIS